MSKSFIFIFLFLTIPTLSWSQYSVSGTLVDSTRNGISGAALILMSKVDSVSIAWEYTRESKFRIAYDNPDNKPLMLYIQAFGYCDVCKELSMGDMELGELILIPRIFKIEEVTVVAGIQYKFTRGKDEFSIPLSLAEKEFDLNSLLANVPGIAVDGDKVTIIGRGAPVYTINGLKPRPGELQNLSPRDVEKITIDRMPSSRYDKTVVGIIDIRTRKTIKDYLSLRVSNDFRMRKEPSNTTGISINNQTGKWSNYLNYSYIYDRSYYETLYENTLHADDEDYLRIYFQSPLFKSNSHTLNYSPKYQINDKSFIDLQYSLTTKRRKGTHPETFDIVEYEFNVSDGNSSSKDNSHNVIGRYVHESATGNKLVLNGGYSRINKKSRMTNSEHITYADNTSETIDTEYSSRFVSEVFSLSSQYDFNLSETIFSETGLEFAEIWNNSLTDFVGGNKYKNDTEETQAAAYFNINQQIGQFYYQAGIRGEYLYKHNATNKDVNSNPYSFLPSVSFSYDVSDNINMTLYFRRSTTHPTLNQRDPILNYVNKYEYSQGNPDLKSYMENELAFRIRLPKNFTVNMSYNYAKDYIIQMDDIYDIETRKTVLTYHNFPKMKNFTTNVTWSGQFGFYRLMLTGTYDQTWAKSPFLDDFINYNKPMLGFRVQQLFRLYKNINLSVVFNYNSAHDWIYARIAESYDLSGNIVMLLFNRKLNVTVGCNNIIYTDQQTWDKYKRISTHNQNFLNNRQFRIGITYNFNNFRDIFKKNESNADILQRIQ